MTGMAGAVQFCPACRTHRSIRRSDGRFREHYLPKTKQVCSGSGTMPPELVDLFERRPEVPLTTSLIYSEIQAERDRQDQKWGQQDHPDGTGPDVRWMVDRGNHTWFESLPTAQDIAGLMRRLCQDAAARGGVTWMEIDLEEVAESYAEDDPTKLRAELVQRAAVLVAWIEAIDRRASNNHQTTEGT